MNAAYWLLAAGSAESKNVGQALGEAGMTALIGVLVVFGVLVLLTFIFFLFGKVAGRGGTKKAPEPKPVPKAPAPAAKTAPKPAAPAGMDDEVVAVIAAAVAAMAPAGKAYRVRRVSEAKPVRTSWAMAGLMDNTRPF